MRRALNVLPDPSKLLLIDLAAAPGLDVTTARILKDFEAQSRSHGTRVVFLTKDGATAAALQREGLERALSVERAVGRWQEEANGERRTANGGT
ncbi:MAG: hypothetical protein IPJ11_13595 [Gemmatimonadetes bacterium]|nr:hypothetical protein [Gemmatimonadota bacterium]